ncbi:hypothetical protein PIB30_016553 [Stylosanthes scabra]|uniref:Uncharacterized protein n=1 Tax=Stylosanthes scabra TaxID=79078 RepID=A0ABU6R7N9_9FABA|nr:hypothetical protein [Stylosanthes scabra]
MRGNKVSGTLPPCVRIAPMLTHPTRIGTHPAPIKGNIPFSFSYLLSSSFRSPNQGFKKKMKKSQNMYQVLSLWDRKKIPKRIPRRIPKKSQKRIRKRIPKKILRRILRKNQKKNLRKNSPKPQNEEQEGNQEMAWANQEEEDEIEEEEENDEEEDVPDLYPGILDYDEYFHDYFKLALPPSPASDEESDDDLMGVRLPLHRGPCNFQVWGKRHSTTAYMALSQGSNFPTF